MSSLFSWLGWSARKPSENTAANVGAISPSAIAEEPLTTRDNGKTSDATIAVLELPSDASLAQILVAMAAGKTLASSPRDEGDVAVEAANTVTDQARANWQIALDVNDRTLKCARRYSDFSKLLNEDGSPAPKINIPLLPAETRFVKMYCDALGQQGGLYRRLGDLDRARKYYAKGAQIEQHADSFAFAGSYSTVNNIAIRIELGEAVAQRSSDLPILSGEIDDGLAMLVAQIEGDGRSSDPWAWSDYAFLMLLSGNTEAATRYVPTAYENYANAAGTRDIKATLRVMTGVATALESAGDQTAVLLRWGIDVLINAAKGAGKLFE